MYDITFLLSCCISKDTKKRHRDRLLFFKKYGLLNFKNHKIKVLLNINKDNNPDDPILKSWDYDTEVLISEHNHIAPKSYYFFSNLKEKHISDTKWLMRIDDDSLTNVAHLLDLLNKKFNYTEPLYLMSKDSIAHKRESVYHDILRRYDLSKYIYEPYSTRELESCLISQAALSNIANYSLSNNFLKSVIEEVGDEGHGDALMSCVAQEANCKIKMVDYMSWYPRWDKLVNKELSHIHFIFRGRINIKNNRVDLLSFLTAKNNVEEKNTSKFFIAKFMVAKCLKKLDYGKKL